MAPRRTIDLGVAALETKGNVVGYHGACLVEAETDKVATRSWRGGGAWSYARMNDNLLKVLVDGWLRAEGCLLESLQNKYWDVDEEFITTALRSELRAELQSESFRYAANRGLQEDVSALLANESGARPHFSRDLDRLFISVRFHPKDVEGKTGGDFGIVLRYPTLERFGAEISLRQGKPRGVLVQAKMRGRKGDWGKFTKNQAVHLGPSLGHTALLLYEYEQERPDEGDVVPRRKLRPLRWQECCSSNWETVESWLGSGTFPASDSSSAFIARLAAGALGTADPRIIEGQIAPQVRDTLEIDFEWRYGDRVEELSTQLERVQTRGE